MIEFWATFWGWVLGASLVIFAVISVVVTIGGFRDIRDLLTQAGSDEEEDADTQSLEDDPGGAEDNLAEAEKEEAS